MKTQTVYITDAQDFSEIELQLRKLVERGYIEKKEDQIVMSKIEFEKYIEDVKFKAHNQGFNEGHVYGKIPF